MDGAWREKTCLASPGLTQWQLIQKQVLLFRAEIFLQEDGCCWEGSSS